MPVAFVGLSENVTLPKVSFGVGTAELGGEGPTMGQGASIVQVENASRA